MNYVQLKEFQCSYLVTKDGGDTGGFKERYRPRKGPALYVFVIDRPGGKRGLSLVQIEEAVKEWMEHGSEMNMKTENLLFILPGSEWAVKIS